MIFHFHSFAETTRRQVSHAHTSTNQSQSSTGTIITNQTRVAVTTTTSSVTATDSTDNVKVLADAKTSEIHNQDSDGESGYVEYETDYQVLCDAINWAADREEQRHVGDYPFDVDDDLVETWEEPKPSYLYRAFKAALPIYLLLVLILFLLFLPPTCLDERYACLRKNNLHFHLNPSMAWTDGPPPT